MKHGPFSTTTLPFLSLAAACALGPLPRDTGTAAMTTDASSGGTTHEPTGPATWPEPPGWGTSPDLGAPDPGTSTGAGSEGPVLTDSSTGAPVPAIDLGALRVSEVLADPEGKDGGANSPEFVEVVHVGAQELALAGLVLAARGWPELRAGDLGLAEQSLAPGERLLVVRFASAGDLPMPPVTRESGVLRAAFADSGGLRNADGGVLLRDEQGAIGDALVYGAAQPAPWDDPAAWTGMPVPAAESGSSLCRIDPATDSDTMSDWQPCPPTPGELPAPPDDTTGEPPLPANVVIVEVLSNPPGPANLEKHAEYVEVVNLGPGPVDLGTWTIADSVLPDAPGADPLLFHGGDGGCAPATCLAPGRTALLVGSLYQGPIGEALVLKTDDGLLANAGLGNTEAVVLRDEQGQLRTSYRAWPDPLVAPDPATMEAALTRAPEAADEPGSWVFAAPTPGL